MTENGRPGEEGISSLPPGKKATRSIYLIKPNGLTPDVTYKVLCKGDSLYFCRVGGQLYGIGEDKELTPEASEEELLHHKKSFRLPRFGFSDVSVDARHSHWTGGIPNDGTLRFAAEGRQWKFIIHPMESPAAAAAFFRRSCSCPVEMRHIDKYREMRRRDRTEGRKRAEPACRTAARLSLALNILSGICALWMLFAERSIAVAGANLFLFAVGFALAVRYREYLSYDTRNTRGLPDFIVALLAPPIAVLFSVTRTCHLMPAASFFLAVGALTLAATVLLAKAAQLSKPSIIGAFLFSLALGLFSIAVSFNCLLDHSVPAAYTAAVVDKYQTSGRDASNTLSLSPWGPQKNQTDVDVREDLYDRAQKGGSVRIELYKGLFGVRWYMVEGE